MGTVAADGPHSISVYEVVLLDDLYNPVGARIDQNRAVVHDRIAIVPRAIFRRHVVIGNALLGQHGADPDILTILIGRPMLFDDIGVKAGPLIDAEHPGDAADHSANDTTDH